MRLRQADPLALHGDAQDLVALSREERLAARLATLPCPVAYIAGGMGGAAPRSLALLRQAGVPVFVVAEAGHWPFVDRPVEFRRILRTCLATALSER